MPRLLKPTEYNALRKQFGATEQNEGQFFTRDKTGNIYLNDKYDPNVTPPAPGGGAADAGGGQDKNAQLWQMLNGGKLDSNPYLPYITPRVITNADGTKVLRIPKNQTMVTLAKFFDTHGQQTYDNTKDFVDSFIKYQQDEQKLANDTAKTAYDINKPYYKPGSSGDGDTTPTTKQGAVSSKPTSTGGLAFFQKQKNGTSKPITAAEYSAITGENIIDVLSKSKDPTDAQIIDQITQLEQLLQQGKVTQEQVLSALQTDYPYVFGPAGGG